MADPSSTTASVLAVATAAGQATKLLQETIQRYKERNRTFRTLQNELEDITNILDALAQVTNIDPLLWALLQGPINRYSQVCREFEQSVKDFSGNSKAGIQDWTKMEFMRGDMGEFVQTIAGYKSTIVVGLATINLQSSKVTHKCLQEYMELTKYTAYDLEMQLQRIDERIVQNTNLNLEDESTVTKQCLRICEDTMAYIESLTSQEPTLTQEAPKNAAEDSIQNLQLVVDRLRQRLESPIEKASRNDEERLRLQEDINVLKQCLEICETASKIIHQKGYRNGEPIVEGDCVSIVVTTLADLFSVKKVKSGARTASLVGSITDKTLEKLKQQWDSTGNISDLDKAVSTAAREKMTSTPEGEPINDSTVQEMVSAHMSRQDIVGFTKTEFDSGYNSMPDAASKNNEQDDDNMSIRSIQSNNSRVVFPAPDKVHLISAFTEDLCEDVGFRGDFDARSRISSRLSDLLRVYALRLEKAGNRNIEYDAKEFVRQQRDHITYQFSVGQMPMGISEVVDPPTRPDDGMSPAEKVALFNSTRHSDFQPDTAPGDQKPDGVKIPPIYQEVRSFLLGGSAYQWLIENARTSALLTERKGTILEEIACKIDATLSSLRTTKSRTAQVFQARFEMDWDLLTFLRGQDYDSTLEVAVEQAITITGSGSNAQALSCVDYMRQTWPSTGREIVHALQKALRSPHYSCSSRLADSTELDISFRSQNALIVARGGQAALTELCEQLAWLGAALRTSPVTFGTYLSTPSIMISKDANSSDMVPSITVCFEFTSHPAIDLSLDHDLSNNAAGTCWHAMFRNPIIVNKFPILARHEDDQGLELSFSMMSVLAETCFATRYDRTLVLKGPCTMLVPTRLAGHSITWHFLSNESGKRITYYAFRERCPDWISIDKVNIGLLETRNVRNFVGWSSEITRHLGTEDMEYDAIDWAGAKKCSAGLAVEQKLTISVSKIFGGSVSFVRGNRDKSEYVHQSGYATQIENAHDIQIVLYDKAAQRGWLVDGASALLHLVRTQVVREPYGGVTSLFNKPSFNRSAFKHPAIGGGPNAALEMLKEDHNLKHIILKEFHSYADEKIDSSLGNVISDIANQSSGDKREEIYKITCLRELVSQTWSTLEQIYDRQIEAAETHTIKQLHSPFDLVLEGYEFMDIVSAKHILTRRAVKLQPNGEAWLKLTKRIHAVTLFGQNFGEIYKPSENTRREICKDWMAAPRGHDYLAIPMSLLKEVRQHSWKAGEIDENLPEIAEGIFWSLSNDAFKPCELSCKHDFDRVQQLRNSKVGKKRGKNAPWDINTSSEIKGAVLFGSNSTLDIKKLEAPSPQAVHVESSFYDSGVGSSLQSPFQTTSVTPSSCGENSV